RRVLPRRIEFQGAPGYGDLAATDTKEPNEIDYRRARFTAFVGAQDGDAAHGLIGRAADLLAEDPAKVCARKLEQARALRRRPRRGTSSRAHGRRPPGLSGGL